MDVNVKRQILLDHRIGLLLQWCFNIIFSLTNFFFVMRNSQEKNFRRKPHFRNLLKKLLLKRPYLLNHDPYLRMING